MTRPRHAAQRPPFLESPIRMLVLTVALAVPVGILSAISVLAVMDR